MKRTSYAITLAAAVFAAELLPMRMTALAQEPNPSINVTDLAVTCISCNLQTGTFDITNESEITVTIVDIFGSIEFISRGGVRTECEQATITHDAPATIAPGETVTVEYTLTCAEDCPPEAREVKNFVDVQIEGRDKLFHGSGSCDLAFVEPE